MKKTIKFSFKKIIKFSLINAAVLVSLINVSGSFASDMQELNFSNPDANVMPVANVNSIDVLQQNIKTNPLDLNSRINLARAYITRGANTYNNRANLSSAANDFRLAIYYLKYDINIPPDQLDLDDVNIAESSLAKVLAEQKISLDPKSRQKLAKELRGEGNFKEAIVEFNESLTNTATNVESFEAMGDIMHALPNDNKAVSYYDQALSLDKNNSNLHLKLARALTNIGNNDAATAEFNKALDLNNNDSEIIEALESNWRSKIQENPNDAMNHMNLGAVLQKKGDFDGAFAQYNIAEGIEPNNIVIRLNLGTLFQAQKKYQLAIDAYNSIIQINPTDTVAHYYRATALQQMGNIQGAIKEFQIVLSIEPNNDKAKAALFEAVKQSSDPQQALQIMKTFALNNPNDALAQYNYAYELHTRKIYDEAIEYYKRTISIDHSQVDAYLNLASILKERNQYGDATTVLNDALRVNPNNQKAKDMLDQVNDMSTNTKYQVAINKYNNKDYQGAINEYLEIMKNNEPDSDLYTGLGAAYQGNNNMDEAIDSYNKAISLNNTNSTAIYYLGTAYYAKQDFGKAREYFDKALALDPKNDDIKGAIADLKSAQVEPAIDKGLKYYNAKKYTLALQSFNFASKLEPSNGYPYYYKGLIYDALKQYSVAVKEYESAVQKSGELSVAYYSLALDYDLLKNKPGAKKAYLKFINTAKKDDIQYIKYAKGRIKQL